MSDAMLDLVMKGGAIGALAIFVALIWAAWGKERSEAREDRKAERKELMDELKVQTEMLNRLVERIARIDERTYRLVSKRTKTPTPFWPLKAGEKEDEES